MGSIQLSIEAYGAEARTSCVSDLVEASALLGYTPTFAQLDETISDNQLGRPKKGLFLLPDDEQEDFDQEQFDDIFYDNDEPIVWSDSVRSTLDQRIRTLGPAYPFEMSGERLVMRKHTNPTTSAYCRLLRLTLAHAFKAELTVRPSTTFELLVADALGKFGLPSVGVGTASSGGADFPAVLAASGRALGLRTHPDPRPRRVSAKDAGVDVLSALNWGDNRPGQLTWITQATVGQSSTWERKLAEPNPVSWMGYLQNGLEPNVILAVPHHVENAHWTYLLERQRAIVDRIRLTPSVGLLVQGELTIEEWFREQKRFI